MKNKFFEHYILSDEESITSIWNDAIFVFDANVLLNLYRYSENSKNDLFKALEYYKDRLWIPFQIGWEYHNNRISVIMDMNMAYEQITTNLEKETIEFIKKLNLSKYKRHPKIDVAWFENQIRTNIKSLCNHLDEMKESCTNYLQNDEINDKVTELFKGKVGDDYNDSELKEISKEGQNRYNEKIPPGYCDIKDKKDNGNRRLYGDLILWKQIIKEAKEKQVNVILITDDTKEDWYEKIKGKTVGPRKELLREFHEETNKNILIYPCNRFLEYAKENIDIEIDQETISEIDEIRKEDEAIKDLISHLPFEDEKIANIFSENPWISVNSINDLYLQSIINPLNLTDSYKDVLGKTSLEHISGLTDSYKDILGKTSVNPIEGLSGLSTSNGINCSSNHRDKKNNHSDDTDI